MKTRRDFIKSTAMIGAGLSILKPSLSFAETQPKKVKLGIIGVGLRGQSHLSLIMKRNDVELVAICDVQQRMMHMSMEMIDKMKYPMPQMFLDGPYGYRKLLEIEDLDAVIIATPWEWHKIMCVDAMKAKKYTACEVITGMTVEECWELVKTSEETGIPMMMLENVCYRRDVMAVLNMVRQNVFGELIHLQGGYQHDLRGVKFNDGITAYNSGVEFGENSFSEAQWRTAHSVTRNGDLYPTHGIGPLAMMTNINRGNRFTKLVSYASKSRGLHEYIVNKGGANHPNAKVNFKLGDVITTMIQTHNGETILLQHDTNLPRPYSLGFRVQGTNGLWMDINKSIYIEGISPQHQWEDAKPWLEKYDSPRWRQDGDKTIDAGHDGMDWFVINDFIEAVKSRTKPPQDVYDAVTWSAITPLSELSLQQGGCSVDFPDFTNGKWSERRN